METITFDSLPVMVERLLAKVEDLEKTLKEKEEAPVTPADGWMNLDELIAYLPDHPAKSTVYNWVSGRRIPFHKGGKKLRFRQSEIDGWLSMGGVKTGDELAREAYSYCENRKIAGL